MSELKTRPTGADVEAFLAAVPDARRRADGQTMAALMTEVTGETARMWGPSIVGYGTYRYRDSKGHEHEWFPVGFSPRKAELTLYILNDHAPYAELIGRLGKHPHRGVLHLHEAAVRHRPRRSAGSHRASLACRAWRT